MTSLPIYPDLKGKVAVITGGSSGIGLDSARRFLGQGLRVAILALEDDLLTEAEHELQKLGGQENVFAMGCDLTKETDVTAAFKETKDYFGEISIVLHSAGISYNAPFEETELSGWQRLIDINLT